MLLSVLGIVVDEASTSGDLGNRYGLREQREGPGSGRLGPSKRSYAATVRLESSPVGTSETAHGMALVLPAPGL